MLNSRPARKVRAYRPRLEVLESRNLLSTYLVDLLADDTIADNVAVSLGGGGGGGIYNSGVMSVSSSSISGNGASGGFEGHGEGGGVLNDGLMTVSHITVSGNGSPYGGGICNCEDYGDMTVSYSSIYRYGRRDPCRLVLERRVRGQTGYQPETSTDWQRSSTGCRGCSGRPCGDVTQRIAITSETITGSSLQSWKPRQASTIRSGGRQPPEYNTFSGG